MILQAEQLPPEIWLYIFRFLEGHDLVRAFSSLNALFSSLLRSPHIQLHVRIKQKESDERLPDWPWSYINQKNIYSLAVGQRKANCLIQFLRWHAPCLTRLSSLSVYLRKSTCYYNIQLLLFALAQLPSLKRLRIKYAAKFDSDTNDLEPLMLNLFSGRFDIQSYSLCVETSNFNTNTSTWSINPFVKHLHMHDITLTSLFAILPFTPQLYSLRVTKWRTFSSDTVVILTDLQKLDVRVPKLSLTQLQVLRKMAPNLQFLRLEGALNSDDENIFQENLWQEFLSNIRYFHVHLEDSTNSPSTDAVFKDRIRNYNGKSWFKYEETERIVAISILFQSAPTYEKILPP